MKYMVMVSQATYPLAPCDSRGASISHWTEIVGVEGDKIFFNDRAIYTDEAKPYGGLGKPPLERPLRFATRAEAEKVVALWRRVYRPGDSVKIVELAEPDDPR